MLSTGGGSMIPGYTGHRPSPLDRDEAHRSSGPRYGGYVPAVKSENMFGETYGKISMKSSAGGYEKGTDLTSDKKYKSMAMEAFVDQKGVKAETAAQIVGVNRGPEIYRKVRELLTQPIPPDTVGKFWGMKNDEFDPVVQTSQFEKNKEIFFEDTGHGDYGQYQGESFDDAAKNFYGYQEPKKTVKLGEPIPGYAGVNQRIGADNIFGYTYADARKKAKDSLTRVDKDRAEQLRATSGFEPTWKN